MSDKVIKIGHSYMQHGKENDRVYLMKLHKSDIPQIIDLIEELVVKHKYTKVIAKIPNKFISEFENHGYAQEAFIPGFYNGIESAHFLSKYHSDERHLAKNQDILMKVLAKSMNYNTNKSYSLERGFILKQAEYEDSQAMSCLYKEVFKSYPFPIFNPEYLEMTMRNNVVYYGIWHGDKIAALASCEMDIESKNVEMTDFATRHQYRGNKFAMCLLKRMEQEMINRGIKTAYTIARAVSYGMNCTFGASNYNFDGTLYNNTNIAGQLESMNVWHKSLITKKED